MNLLTKKVLIGEKEFVLSELQCKNRRVLLELFANLQLPAIFNAFSEALRSIAIDDKSERESTKTIFDLVATNPELIRKFISTLLDTTEVLVDIVCLSVVNGSDEDEKYIRDSITCRQESSILNILIEINELPKTLKNYKSLLTGAKTIVDLVTKLV